MGLCREAWLNREHIALLAPVRHLQVHILHGLLPRLRGCVYGRRNHQGWCQRRCPSECKMKRRAGALPSQLHHIIYVYTYLAFGCWFVFHPSWRLITCARCLPLLSLCNIQIQDVIQLVLYVVGQEGLSDIGLISGDIDDDSIVDIVVSEPGQSSGSNFFYKKNSHIFISRAYTYTVTRVWMSLEVGEKEVEGTLIYVCMYLCLCIWAACRISSVSQNPSSISHLVRIATQMSSWE